MTRTSFTRSRALVAALRELDDVPAPRSLWNAVKARVVRSEPDNRYTRIETVLGPLYVVYSDRGVVALQPAESDAELEARLRARLGHSARRDTQPPARFLTRAADALSGRRRNLSFDLSPLSEFEQAVLQKTLEIPRGEVRPYSWIAREIGQPRAVRAVGTALRRNPIPLLIPCHRVVRTDGSLGEYAFGAEAKRIVLQEEGLDVSEVEREAARGLRYVGSATTKVFCLPTCRHARRVTERHRREFTSEVGARSAGFRPCRVCRPAAAS
ncbi:MAG: methylated-DNA--[protein]-cysteine S-methyltransferase [Chloroflexi bacterium]|nr:methylated-DNA--[protein]-cysteine S-methyltransferase [Chloroflexota bacterium]